MNLMSILQEEAASDVLQAETIVVAMLTIAALVAIFARYRSKLPYTVALVLVGLGLTFIPNDFFTFEAEVGDLILFVLVPPLIFEATLHISWGDLKRDLFSIVMLAVFGSILGALIVGWMVHNYVGLGLFAAAAFGVLISATDPVAVVSVFRSLGVDKRLALLVEGESLFNDGVAIVLFAATIALAENGIDTFSFTDTLLDFVRVAGGGLIIGTALGFAVSGIVLQLVDDHLIETASTVALAFGAFIAAELFHVSGILAVVAAGLIAGNWGRKNTSATTDFVLNSFWEFLAFVANSFVFLLIGLEAEIAQMITNWHWILLTVLVVVVSRLLIIYGLTAITDLLQRALKGNRPIPANYKPVMWWGGLRGAISLALALSLIGNPDFLNESSLIITLTFGVVLFTLLAQATTLPNMLNWLHLTETPEHKKEQQRKQGVLIAKRAGKEAVRQLHQQGAIAPDVWKAVEAVYDEDIKASAADLLRHLNAYAELTADMVMQTRAEALQAERAALNQAAKRGLISEGILDELARDLDDKRSALDMIRGRQQNQMADKEAFEPPQLEEALEEGD